MDSHFQYILYPDSIRLMFNKQLKISQEQIIWAIQVSIKNHNYCFGVDFFATIMPSWFDGGDVPNNNLQTPIDTPPQYYFLI